MHTEMDDALQTFIAESRELLFNMEEALLEIEERGTDPDRINALFRAAHTIKGSAGLFSLDYIVDLTHVAESVLDRVRDQRLGLGEELGRLFIEVCDQLGVLVGCAAAGAPPDAAIDARSGTLVRRLGEYLEGAAGGLTPGAGTDAAAAEQGRGGAAVGSGLWHISLRGGPDLLRYGLDPLSILRYLNTFGQIVSLEVVLCGLPRLSEIDPERCYLGFELSFATQADAHMVEDAFTFIREDCAVRLIPPYGAISDYQALFEALPEDHMLLGEMLVRCGSLTRDELAQALLTQSQWTVTTREADLPAPLLGEVLVAQQLVEAPVVEAALSRQQQASQSKGAESSLIRVDAAKLDQLINLVGELIIAGAGAQLAARRFKAPALIEATSVLSRLVEDVRDSALYLRMVQIGATFNRFRRVVRDVADELGKDIHLEIHGGETELDKTVVERIGDPLTHIVRNALDHGIEPADVRLAQGKRAQGRLVLNAYHESGSIVIEVSDDGGGLRRERILQKAVERGLLAEGLVPGDKELFNLVFEPGFSTADQVSNLSGRGVGMDVVKRNIQALRGTVDIESREGVGTTVRIRLPLTLAIIDGFLIGAGSASYVVPLEQVVECIELPDSSKPGAGGSTSHYLNLRGEVLPFIRLRELFELPGERPRRENVVVVQYAGARAGLVVDQLFGEFQTVIKPLGKVFSHVRCIGGSTILGSGEVALILDVPGLVRHVTALGAIHPPISFCPAPSLA